MVISVTEQDAMCLRSNDDEDTQDLELQPSPSLAETSPPSLCGSKRPAPEKTFENPTKRKNEDYIEDDMDVEIEKKKLGMFAFFVN